MKSLYILIFLFLLSAVCVSCNKYLDEMPDSSLNISIDSEEKIAELLSGAYPKASYIPFLEPRTDNADERAGGTHFRMNEAMYFWQDFDQEDLDTPLNYWNDCYRGIAQTNKALEYLKDYPKTSRVKALYAEAFLLRSYLHFMLVSIWSSPYNPNTYEQDLGIPYIKTPEKYAIVNYKRGTVKEVYEQIEKDLLLGTSLVDDTYYKNRKYHFTKDAAYAFACRFYLNKGDWDNVIKFSNVVLGHNPALRVRDWMVYFDKITSGLASGKYYALPSEPANILITTTESRYCRNFYHEKYGLNAKLAHELFSTGFSSSNLHHTWAYTYSGGNMVRINKFDEFVKFGSTGLNPRGIYVDNVLFSFDEVLLARAEALSMKGRFSEAVSDLQIFLNKKAGGYYVYEDFLRAFPKTKELYTPFYSLNSQQSSIIQFISELRRREFVVEGLRWFDIQRFNLPVSRNRIDKPHKEENMLVKSDKRRILQIPSQAIALGLEANPR